MAITDFLGKIVKKEEKEDTTYLSLALTPDEVLATIWAFEQNKVSTLGFAKKSFQNVDSIIHQAAIAIDTAAERAKSDVSEVVFGLSGNWFEDDQISKETSKLLKKLSEDLELSAQAFVPISASIKNYLKVEESVTPHAVIIGAFSNFSEAHLVKKDEVALTKTSNSKPTIEKITDLVKGLKDEETLPARIIVFGVAEDSKLAGDISKANWQESFTSEPKVEFMNDKEVSKAVAYSQAADILGHEPALKRAGAAAAVASEVELSPQESKAEVNELGFVEGEDILKGESAESHQDVDEEKISEAEAKVDKVELRKEDLAVEVDQNTQEPPVESKTSEFPGKESIIEQITTLGWLAKITDIFKSRTATKKLTIGLGAIFIIGFIGILVAGRTLTSAEVVIKVNAKFHEDSFDVDVARGGSANFESQQIAGREITGKANGSRKAVATGTKELGESAKGEVSVLNWTTSETDFTSGTVIISSGGIKFSLDSNISVASRSASTPGKSTTAVTAVDFGSEGNLQAGTDFTFQEFDELLYSATSENSFAGGDEKEVTVVSEEDLDKLEESLLDSLKENAINSLKENATDQNFLEDSIVVEVTKKIFDSELDEEASLINLDLEVEATAISYRDDDLKSILAENVKEEAPENLEAKAENIQIKSLDGTSTISGLNLSGDFEARFTPKFDEDNLKEQIAGKSVKEVREIIKGLPEVSDVTVNFSPNYFFANTLPGNKDKISFKVES